MARPDMPGPTRYGPHTPAVVDALARIQEAGPVDFARADRIHSTHDEWSLMVGVSRWSETTGRVTTDAGNAWGNAVHHASQAGVSSPQWPLVADGLHLITVADLLTPDRYSGLIRWLVATIGPVPWPATHPLCALGEPCEFPLGWHMARESWKSPCRCGRPWPGMTADETATAKALVRDQVMPWEEIPGVVARLR